LRARLPTFAILHFVLRLAGKVEVASYTILFLVIVLVALLTKITAAHRLL